MEYSCKRYLHIGKQETAYKGLVRPILEYASPVWDPQGIVELGLWLETTTLKLEVWLAFLNS